MLWQRYLFKHLCKCFFLFLCSFFFLYSLIDFSTHAQDFFVDGTLSLSKLALYYSNQLIKRLQLLLPLALLISAIKTLTSFNRHRELVALLSAGIPLKKLLQPFFVLAFLCMATGYLNEEVLMPRSTAFLEEIKQTQVSLKKNKKKPFHVLYLQDSSRLIYQTFDEEHQSFFDVYWIRSFSDFWRIKTLHADPKNPIACYVDHIVRN